MMARGPSMELRPASDSDLPAIGRLHVDAFGPQEGPEVADLVADLLRDETALPRVSIVAEADGVLAGHVLFTAAGLDSDAASPVASILAPLGVASGYQRQGVGGLLVDRGLALLIEQAVDLVFVLGHPSYYPRFGFRPARELGFDAPYPILPENDAAWMVKALQPGALDRFAGTVACASALDRPEHWTE